ncbi:MAG: metallophosphoesterase [Planctomycetes bacterium]|nr:metallophosphoesterase [Planctomycetota bacterium]
MSEDTSRLIVPHPFSVRAAHWVGRTWARVSYGRRIEPTWLEINRPDIPILELPTVFNNFKIAQLSDIHGGHHLPDDYLNRAIDSTLAEQSDLITLTGDFIHKGYRHVDSVTRMLERLRAPFGVFAVLGNHDFSVRNATGFRRHRGLHAAVAAALTDAGIRVLRNESIPLERDGCLIHLTGLDDLWSGECNPDLAMKDLCPRTPRILLAHNPQTIHLLGEHRCDLMLSGHTHGGQINWPGLGRFFLGRKGRQFAAGLYRHLDSHLYVNKGVGFGWRFRFGVRPELAVLTLRKQ